MILKEIFKNVTFSIEEATIYDLDGCEVGTMELRDNGIIFYIKGFEKFYDEYEIERQLKEEVSTQLINWINEN